MNILETLVQLRDDLKTWVTNNLNTLNNKIDEKTIPVDSRLSTTSINPVQNKVITNAINNIPRFSGDYNDLTNAPNIAEDGSGNMIIADESGNVIFKADADGIHTTAVSIDGADVSEYISSGVTDAKEYTDEQIGAMVGDTSVPDQIQSVITHYYTKDESDTAINNLKTEMSESIMSESSEWKIVDGNGNVILNVDADGIQTTSLTLDGRDVSAMIDEVTEQITIATTEVKNDLLNGAGEAYDTLKELGDLIDDNVDAIDALEIVATSKADKTDVEALHGLVGDTSVAEQINTAVNMHTDNSTIHITAAERSSWNAKSEFDGDYNSLANAPNITEDGSDNMIVTDNNSNIILKVDENGLETTVVSAQNISLNGEDVGVKIDGHTSDTVAHITTAERNAWNAKSDFSGSYTDLTDVPDILADAQAYTNEQILGLVGDTPVAEQIDDAVSTHTDNGEIHITQAERVAWSNKSEFNGDYNSLTNLPNILDDESPEFTISDSSGNAILKVDADGVHTTDVEIDGQQVSELFALQGLIGDTAVATQISDAIANYYTKNQIDNYEFITVDDIDAICGASIAKASEVTF